MVTSVHLTFIIALTSVSTLEPSQVCSVHYNSSGCSRISITDLCSTKIASWVATVAEIIPKSKPISNEAGSQFDLVALYHSAMPECFRFVSTYFKGPSLIEFSLLGTCAKMSSLAIKFRFHFPKESTPNSLSNCAKIFVDQIKPDTNWMPFRGTIGFEFVVHNYMMISTDYVKMLLIGENPVSVAVDGENVEQIEAQFGTRINRLRSTSNAVQSSKCNCDMIVYYNEWVANNSRERAYESVSDYVFNYDYPEVLPRSVSKKTSRKVEISRNSGMLSIVVVTTGALLMIIGVTIYILKEFEKQEFIDDRI